METAFVLHRRRYRETSLIVELLVREQGRIAAVAKGALRKRSPLQASLVPLVPLGIELGGRGELRNLNKAEPQGPAIVLDGTALFSTFYLNELLLKLSAAYDPMPAVFDSYAATLSKLKQVSEIEPALRRFECLLLTELGLGIDFRHTVDGQVVNSQDIYDVFTERGVEPAHAVKAQQAQRIHGSTLQCLAGQATFGSQQLVEAKKLMRHIIDHALNGRPLASRELFQSTPRSHSGNSTGKQ